MKDILQIMFRKFLLIIAVIFEFFRRNDCQITVKDTVPIYKRFIAEGIVPHVIDSPPNYTATISFPYDVKVFPGVILNILEVETKPRPRWRAIDDATYYTVIMISPDLPQHKVPYAEWNPWIIRNIPGLKVARGQTVIPYSMPSEPRRDAIFFMYVFLIYKQKEFITHNDTYYENQKMIESGEFRVRRYTEIYNLTAPEAGNYYVLTFYQPPAEVETTRSTLHFEW